MKAKLDSTGLLGGVSAFIVGPALPTLQSLQTYDALLVYTDMPISDEFGDLLADYVDAGGRVVDAVFSGSATYGIGGRWRTDGYGLIGEGGTSGEVTLSTNDAAHPIMNGVTSFSGGESSYRSNAGAVPGSTVVAYWSDNTALVVTREASGNRRVSLNFYPPSSDARGDFWTASTDGARLMANALLWVAEAEAPVESFEAVPEPATFALLGVSLVGIVMVRRYMRGNHMPIVAAKVPAAVINVNNPSSAATSQRLASFVERRADK